MTIVQLQYLLAVANHGNFSVAAEHCFVTQPSLSMQIKTLEDDLGVVLLDRSRKPVVPTEAGRMVVGMAQTVLDDVESIRRAVEQMRGELSGTLRLGVIPTIAPYLVHKFLPDFVARYPHVEVQIREMRTGEIVDALDRDFIDVAIVAGGTCGDSFHEVDLFSDHFYAYVSTRNPLFAKSNIRLEDIDPREMVLLSTGNCMRDQVVELCQARGMVQGSCTFESGSIESLMRIVDCTALLTIIPEMALEFIGEEHASQVKTLAKGTSFRKVSLAYRRTYAKRSMVDALEGCILSSVGRRQ